MTDQTAREGVGGRPPVSGLVRRILELHTQGGPRLTLLGVCPNAAAVVEATALVAARTNAPMLLAATLNQVDRDGGYTGWTPASLTRMLYRLGRRYGVADLLYPCLDHGGPWLKDAHTTGGLSLAATTRAVRASLRACIRAGYELLHIDATVDRTLPPGTPVAIERVIERTASLIAFCEAERRRLGRPPLSYEVGTEEVHGGLADLATFGQLLQGLQAALVAQGLSDVWPCFVVGKVGTDLHTTTFEPAMAQELYRRVAPRGALIKGHYTDWVANPEAYPETGMGGANVGPEFTAVEYDALQELAARETQLARTRPGVEPSGIMAAIEQEVLASGRWRKWLQPAEQGAAWEALEPARRAWLVQTGARYIWARPRVLAARQRLYANLRPIMARGKLDPHAMVVERLAAAIERYVSAFNLLNAWEVLSMPRESATVGKG